MAAQKIARGNERVAKLLGRPLRSPLQPGSNRVLDPLDEALILGEIFRRSSYTAAASSIASTEFPRPECIFWTRAAATLGTCSSAPKICSLKPPAQRHSLALIPASVLPWEIASAHRIADGGGHL